MPRKKVDNKANQPSFRYQGFENPNGTVVPDDVFDVLMPQLTEAELRVLLYIIRRTFGFKKNSDAISLSQMVNGITTQEGRVLDSGTGLSRRGVMRGCAGLVDKGVITVDKRLSPQGDNEINVYQLRFRSQAESDDSSNGGVGNELPYRGAPGAPGVGNQVPPQQTDLQQTDLQRSTIRNRSDEIVDNSEDETDTPSAAQERLDEQPNRSVDDTPMAQTRASAGLGNIGALVAQRGNLTPRPTPTILKAVSTGHTRKRRKTVHQDQDYQVILAYMKDFSRELNDQAPLSVTTKRAYNLYKRSGLDVQGFVQELYAARSIVKERTSTIQNRGEDSTIGPMRHKAAYYFAVLEDLLGFREGENESGSEPEQPADPA